MPDHLDEVEAAHGMNAVARILAGFHEELMRSGMERVLADDLTRDAAANFLASATTQPVEDDE